MKIRLGVIGPYDSIEIVKKAIINFDEIILLPFPYERIEETESIILENRNVVDQWFFSGQAPYYYAVANKLIRAEEGSFTPLTSNSIYKTLLEAQLKEQRVFKSISLDTVQETGLEVKESIKSIELHTFSYQEYLPIPEIISFHEKLYREGKVDIVITCVNSVYNKLKEDGIPCYRVAPDIIAIRMTINYLKQRGVSQWYRKAQIAILGVEISQLDLEWQHSYKTKYQELDLRKLLLNYAERINGSFVEIGDGRYFIYTTRGEVELQLNEDSLFQLMEESNLRSKLQIRMGLGYGITSLEAEWNARLATQYARGKQVQSIVIVDENKKVTEYEGHEQRLSYKNRMVNDEWNELLMDANISPATVDRIQSLAHYYKKKEITSKELASWMNSTERNARRILTELESANLAKITGVEQSGQKGRPRQVFELLFVQ